MNTHTVRRHVEALDLHQQIKKMTDPFLTSHRPRTLAPVLVRLSTINPQLQLGEKRMINLKASPKGEGFSPIPRRRIK